MKKILQALTFSWILQTIGRKCIDSYLTEDYLTCLRGIILIFAILFSIQTYYFIKKTLTKLIPITKRIINELVVRMKTALQ